MNIRTLLICLCCLLGIAAARAQTPVVSLSDAAGQPGDDVTVNVSVQHASQMSALQMALQLDEHLTYVEGSATLNTALTNGHTLSAGMKDGQLQLVLYDLGLHALKESNEALFSFKLKLDKQPGIRLLQPTALKAVDAEGNELSAVTATPGHVTTLCAQATYGSITVDFGHVPLQNRYSQPLAVTNSGTTDLTITNLLFSATTFSSNVALPLTIAPGSSVNIPLQFTPQKRGAQQAKVRVVSNSTGVRNDITLTADPYAVNELHVADGLEGEAGNEIEVPLKVNNMDALCGFQFEFDLPEQVSYVEGSFRLSDRSQGHQLSATCTKGHLIALAYSPTNACFKDNDGVIATFKVKLIGPYGCNLQATKALLTALIDDNAVNVTSANYGSYITIRAPSISVDWGDIDMGRMPVTQKSQTSLTLHNYGNATLRIERLQLRDGLPIELSADAPFEVAPWQSKTITLTYETLAKGDFSDVLQIYSNDPSNRLVERTVRGSRYEPNSVALQALPSTANEATLALSLDNYNEVSGIQFDMKVPTGFSFDAVDDLLPQDRFLTFSVNCQALSQPNLYRVFIYNLTDEMVARGIGDVLFIQLHPTTDDAFKNNAALQLSNIKVGGPNLTDVGNYATWLSAIIPEPVVTNLLNATDNAQAALQGAIYTLSGIKVGVAPHDWAHLPSGIYIYNGKRILK